MLFNHSAIRSFIYGHSLTLFSPLHLFFTNLLLIHSLKLTFRHKAVKII